MFDGIIQINNWNLQPKFIISIWAANWQLFAKTIYIEMDCTILVFSLTYTICEGLKLDA